MDVNNYRKFCPEQIHCFHLGTIKMNLKCFFSDMNRGHFQFIVGTPRGLL